MRLPAGPSIQRPIGYLLLGGPRFITQWSEVQGQRDAFSLPRPPLDIRYLEVRPWQCRWFHIILEPCQAVPWHRREVVALLSGRVVARSRPSSGKSGYGQHGCPRLEYSLCPTPSVTGSPLGFGPPGGSVCVVPPHTLKRTEGSDLGF